jgi:hypothetical protein
MNNGIFRPRQGVQRVTANAGNRAFIAGGRGPGRRLPAKAPPTLRQKAVALAIILSGGGPVAAADGIPMPPAAPEPPPPGPIPVPAAWESQR